MYYHFVLYSGRPEFCLVQLCKWIEQWNRVSPRANTRGAVNYITTEHLPVICVHAGTTGDWKIQEPEYWDGKN